jgi:hypothetical protein
MHNITIFTIVYNNYGVFLDRWVKFVKRTHPKEIIVVLGKNHGVDTSLFEGVKFIECDSDVMGTLRNEAIKAKRFKRCLYFSVDDELLPNATQQIMKKMDQGFKVVGLKYNDIIIIGNKTTAKGEKSDICAGTVRDSFIGEPKNWRKSNVPGWVAVEGKYLYEEIEVPNYPYLFQLKDLPKANTEEVVANYKRRKGSHGDIAKEGNFQSKFVEEIEKWRKHYDNV